MRAQFFDGFDFATYKFSIVAIEDVDEFFNIEEFGLHPIMYNEACLRGYTAIFGFNDEKMLTLHKLLTNNNGMEPPAIDGIHPVPFHSPAGFQLPHAFRKVYELTFDKGLFVKVQDHSQEAQELRIEYEEPLTSKKKMQIKWGNLTHKSEEYGFDDETIAQYMDLSYDTKYLFEHL